MSPVRIDRKQKNNMRSCLEKVLQQQKEVDREIDNCQPQIEAEEYKNFLVDLKARNNENIKIVSNYMVRKCNR